MSVVVPLIHGLNIFGLDLMNKKAFTYTMVAKVGCLLSGTTLYAVSLPFDPYRRRYNPNTRDLKDEVSRKLVAWEIRHVQLPFLHAHPSGLRRCYPDDRVSGSLRLCLLTYYLLGLLSYYLFQCCRASKRPDEWRPSNLGSAVGDSGSKKILLKAWNVDIHNGGENIYSKDRGSSP